MILSKVLLAALTATTLSAPRGLAKVAQHSRNRAPKKHVVSRFHGVRASGNIGVGATHFLRSNTPLLFDLDDFGFECKISNYIDRSQNTEYDLRFCHTGAADFGIHQDCFSVRAGVGYDPIATCFGASALAYAPSLKVEGVHTTQTAQISVAYIPVVGLGWMTIPLTRSPRNILMCTAQAHSTTHPSISGAIGCSAGSLNDRLIAEVFGELGAEAHQFDLRAKTQLLGSVNTQSIHNLSCKYNISPGAMVGINTTLTQGYYSQWYVLGKHKLQNLTLQCRYGLNTHNKRFQLTYAPVYKQAYGAALDLCVGQNAKADWWCGVAISARLNLASEFKPT